MKTKFICFIICIVLVISGVFLFNSLVAKQDFSQYNSKLWNEYPSEREKMLDDFMKRYDIYSMNKNQVISELGTNDATISDSSIIYTIGADFFSNHLIIEFDDNNMVKNYRTYSD